MKKVTRAAEAHGQYEVSQERLRTVRSLLTMLECDHHMTLVSRTLFDAALDTVCALGRQLEHEYQPDGEE